MEEFDDLAARAPCETQGHRYAPVDLRTCKRCGFVDKGHPGYKWWVITDGVVTDDDDVVFGDPW